MREVFWSAAALADLEAAVSYIAMDNPTAALKVLDRIEKKATNLGRTGTGRRGRVAGTYEKSVTRLPYIVAYAMQRLPSGGERIVIVCVIHSARNWPKGAGPGEQGPD